MSSRDFHVTPSVDFGHQAETTATNAAQIDKKTASDFIRVNTTPAHSGSVKIANNTAVRQHFNAFRCSESENRFPYPKVPPSVEDEPDNDFEMDIVVTMKKAPPQSSLNPLIHRLHEPGELFVCSDALISRLRTNIAWRSGFIFVFSPISCPRSKPTCLCCNSIDAMDLLATAEHRPRHSPENEGTIETFHGAAGSENRSCKLSR